MNINQPHRRLNLLTGDWVLVSPHRARRPWQGQIEKLPSEVLPAYDPTCYLCPGNTRNTGARNPDYTSTFVFDNDFAALLPPQALEGQLEQHLEEQASDAGDLFIAEAESGVCRVVCFSPRHDMTLPEMPLEDVERVIRTWTDQTVDLGRLDYVNYVQVFENRGAMMGASNPHPHSQIWATSHIPNEPSSELSRQAAYAAQHGSCLLCDYLAAERAAAERAATDRAGANRIIAENEHFTALIPFWAVWPFEVLLVASRHVGSLVDLNDAQVAGLADIMHRVTVAYDNLFEISFPYSMGFHQAPVDGKTYPHQHLHAHYYPPLLRSATVRKFMVGFEMLGMPQRDITPEIAAVRLREQSSIHYKHTGSSSDR